MLRQDDRQRRDPFPAIRLLPPEEPGCPLSPLEMQVIAVGLSPGEHPGVLTGRPEGFLKRLLYYAFGQSPARPLADERLEVLRAMAAAIGEKPLDPDPRVVAAFIRAGWQRDHIVRIRDMVVNAKCQYLRHRANRMSP